MCRYGIIWSMPDLKKQLSQGLLYPKRFLEGRYKKPGKTIDSLKKGEGAVVEISGKKVAAFKSEQGKLVTLSPVCKHLGCFVDWNGKEKSWDCPCHGSRYKADGTVFVGPAKKNLDKFEI